MKIRSATLSGANEINRIHLEAFGAEEGPRVAPIAVELLKDETAQPAMAFVAEAENGIVGCVLFSAMKLREHEQPRASMLGPLAVLPTNQGAGIGTALVNHGLEALKNGGQELVLAYGDPRYYVRFGFTAKHQVKAPHPLTFPAAWLARELAPGKLACAGGIADCSQTFDHPEYW